MSADGDRPAPDGADPAGSAEGEGALDRLLEAARAGTLYGAGLPERALRALVGAAGGVLRESARAAVPDALKGSKLYELTVRKMLRFVVEDVGGLAGACGGGEAPGAAPPAGTDYVVKKAIGNAIDIASLAALHVSPSGSSRSSATSSTVPGSTSPPSARSCGAPASSPPRPGSRASTSSSARSGRSRGRWRTTSTPRR